MNDAEFRRRAHAWFEEYARHLLDCDGCCALGTIEAGDLVAAGPAAPPPEPLPEPIPYIPPWRMGSLAGEKPTSIYQAIGIGLFVKDCPSQADAEREVLAHNAALPK